MRHFLKILQVTMSWKILGTHYYFLDFFPKTFISISLSPVSVFLGVNKMVTSFRQHSLGGGKEALASNLLGIFPSSFSLLFFCTIV